MSNFGTYIYSILMKKIYSLSAAVLCFILSQPVIKAQDVVTLHHSGVTTPYYGNSAFTDAYSASVNYDTIILPGAFYNPPSSIDKKLTIIGTGHFPDSTSATGVTKIMSSLNITSNADSLHLEGLYISGSINFESNQAINDVVIKRNYITGDIVFNGDRSVPCYRALIVQNVFVSLSADNTLQITVSNNHVMGAVYRLNTSVLENNIMYNTRYSGWPYYCEYVFFDLNQSLIQNNIFLIPNNNFLCAGGVNNVFNKNIFLASPSLGSGTESGNSYNVAQNSIFVNQSGSSFNYAHDYHLQFPAIYIGSDGSQIGIYGGLYPFKEGAVPSNPHIQSKTISAITNSNGELSVDVKVSAQDQ